MYRKLGSIFSVWIIFFLLSFSFASAQTSCLLYPSNSTPPGSPYPYGASWDVTSVGKELLVKSDCPTSGNTITITVGKGDTNQFIWQHGYMYNTALTPPKWATTTLSGTIDANGWVTSGSGSHTITTPFTATAANPLYFVGYVCTYHASRWKCGCRDLNCTSKYWQLQGYTGNGGGSSTGGTTGVGTVAAPTITPNGSTFTTSQSVTLTTTTAGAEIRYTTDGSTPTTSSTLYGGVFTLTNTATVKAKAWKAGMTESGVASAVFTKGGAAQKNILLIIADDFGVEATNLYPIANRRATTPAAVAVPRLRSLATQGVLFANFWAYPSCTPTRSTIFTGRYGFRTGMGRPCSNDEAASTQRAILASEFSLPEAFKASSIGSNYELSHIGKWHLSWGINDPNTMGWPYFAGPDPRNSTAGLSNYMNWSKVINGTASTETTYNTTELTNLAIARINAAEAAAKPYFIWLAYNAPHSPYHKPPNDLHTHDSITSCTNRRPCYEAMIEALDTEIGRLLGEVNLTNTTVIFMGDNGTPNETIAAPYDSNHAKLRIYEDGIRVPLLIAGAGVANPGRVEPGLAGSVDLYPTILRIAGINPSDVVPGSIVQDGVSLMPYLAAPGAASVRPYSYSEQFMNSTYDGTFERAIRNARYKLIKRPAGHPSGPPQEFYDLQTDPYEQNNLLDSSLTATQQTNRDALQAALTALMGTI